jgi:D-alanine--poly(phosphoribitol) ligase subunit 1
VPDQPQPGVQPVGRPLPGTTVQLEPTDGAHSITIGTAFGSLGYLADTGTADDHQRLRRTGGVTTFRTQDRGRITADGDLMVVGRLDSLVKRNGTFVDIAGMENAAADLPEVRTACCVHVDATGQIVLAVDGPDVTDPVTLRRRLRPRLGMELPDHIVALPALPLLPSGKVDRQRLRAMLA